MKILLTGASSFTGMWFAQELSKAGHQVVAPLFRKLGDYTGLRKKRVSRLQEYVKVVENCPFGSDSFLDLIGSFDLFCHHAAWVKDYKSPDFDVDFAVKNNTHNLDKILVKLKEKGCHHLLLTGSVFEPGEGRGSDGLRAVSPYGMSKGLTSQVIEQECQKHGCVFGKFVIPNPFGPYEEPRFTRYLINCWRKGEVAGVNTPDYVRDNIHVELLAKSYVSFAEELARSDRNLKLNPSGIVGPQGDFAKRFAVEMEKRLGMRCEVELHDQVEFVEPKKRINTDVLDVKLLDFDEDKAWDQIADFYTLTK